MYIGFPAQELPELMSNCIWARSFPLHQEVSRVALVPFTGQRNSWKSIYRTPEPTIASQAPQWVAHMSPLPSMVAAKHPKAPRKSAWRRKSAGPQSKFRKEREMISQARRFSAKKPPTKKTGVLRSPAGRFEG